MKVYYKQQHNKPRVHVQVWVEHNGPVPEGFVVDHINGDKLDNRIENLRIATYQQNSFNMKKPISNRSGLKGLSWDSSRLRWRGSITAYKQHTFRSEDLLEVCAWIFRTREELHGQFRRVG